MAPFKERRKPRIAAIVTGCILSVALVTGSLIANKRAENERLDIEHNAIIMIKNRVLEPVNGACNMGQSIHTITTKRVEGSDEFLVTAVINNQFGERTVLEMKPRFVGDTFYGNAVNLDSVMQEFGVQINKHWSYCLRQKQQ